MLSTICHKVVKKIRFTLPQNDWLSDHFLMFFISSVYVHVYLVRYMDGGCVYLKWPDQHRAEHPRAVSTTGHTLSWGAEETYAIVFTCCVCICACLHAIWFQKACWNNIMIYQPAPLLSLTVLFSIMITVLFRQYYSVLWYWKSLMTWLQHASLQRYVLI